MNYFPIALAGGRAFCNRKEELKRIHYNVKNGNPTLLISPRRYGKTSLALQAFETLKQPYAHVDLYKALSEEDIARFILNGIGQLLGRFENTPQKLMKVAAEFFGGFQLKFVLENYGLSVELNSKRDKKPIELILGALERLEAHAKKRKKQAILFLDEFQVVGEVNHSSAIEAAIREAVQKSKHIRYLFSGSNRHLIETMFNDKKRPFYNLCDRMTLGRIQKQHYIPYIQHAAKERWKHTLTEAALDTIFSLTELHPYYVNKLCSLIWQNTRIPNAQCIQEIWFKYVSENKSSVEKEIALLRLNQRKLLIHLAVDETKEPFSNQFAVKWGMSSTSIHRAMQALIEKDYVYIDDDKTYKILDPLLKSVLAN